ncbi:sulfatase-like hydrolase/transferase [Vallitaleaceae bacterium 9-2]
MRIVFIDIDTLRPDHMGCYGYHRDTTSNIDIIAKEGVLFNNYYTSDAPCLPSRAALISRIFCFRNGAVGHGGTAADRRLTGKTREIILTMFVFIIFLELLDSILHPLVLLLNVTAWWFNAGLNETYNVGGQGMESGEEVIPHALDW